MSDDIVARLRGQACPECGLPSTHNQFDEAADEIERLGELLFQEIHYGQEKVDEIELLRAELNLLKVQKKLKRKRWAFK
jgi:hypothetical protein